MDLLVVSVPGLSARLLRDRADSLPVLTGLAKGGPGVVCTVVPVVPVELRTMEATYATALLPAHHGATAAIAWSEAKVPGLRARVADRLRRRLTVANLFYEPQNDWAPFDVELGFDAAGNLSCRAPDEPDLETRLLADLGPPVHPETPEDHVRKDEWEGRAVVWTLEHCPASLAFTRFWHLSFGDSAHRRRVLPYVDKGIGDLAEVCAVQGRAMAIVSEFALLDDGACAGQDSDPLDRPVLIASGFELSKPRVGACEVAGILEGVLTGVQIPDRLGD